MLVRVLAAILAVAHAQLADSAFSPPCSANTCEDLNWHEQAQRCADVYGGSDHSCGMPRADCSKGAGAWGLANAFCEQRGARLCTADDFQKSVGQHNGCEIDSAWSWTLDTCEGGHIAATGGSGCSAGTKEYDCRPDADPSVRYGRCCADHATSSECTRGAPAANTTTVTATTRTTVSDTAEGLRSRQLQNETLSVIERLIEEQVSELDTRVSVAERRLDATPAQPAMDSLVARVAALEAKSAEQASVVNQQRQLIIEQQRQTETLLRILSTVGDANTTTPSPPAPGAGCRPKGAVAGEPPAIEAAADDALSLAITACSGEIDFHTGVCSVNPCRLQQRVQALEARLAQLGAL